MIPGGLFLIHTPNVLGYSTMLARLVPERFKPWLIALLEERKEADVFRTYYRANSPRRLADVGARAGFETTETRMIVTSAMFGVVPPLAVAELIWIRLLMTRPLLSLARISLAYSRKAMIS